MRLRVVIVDDDPWFRDTARELLRARGYAVVGEAADHVEALAAVRDLRPDWVLLDVHLPGVDGLEAAGRLSRASSCPRVLLTSSDREAATDELAERSGAVGFVPKTELASADLARYLVSD